MSWGTRQGPKKLTDLEDDRNFWQKIIGVEPTKKKKRNSDSDDVSYEGAGCSCILCPKIIKKETLPSPVQPSRTRQTVSRRETRLSRRSSNIAEAIIMEEQKNEEYHAASTSEFNTDDVFEDDSIPAEVTQGQTLERIIQDHPSDEYIQFECDYGGLTIEELRETNNLDWTLKMTNYTEDGEYHLERNIRQV